MGVEALTLLKAIVEDVDWSTRRMDCIIFYPRTKSTPQITEISTISGSFLTSCSGQVYPKTKQSRIHSLSGDSHT